MTKYYINKEILARRLSDKICEGLNCIYQILFTSSDSLWRVERHQDCDDVFINVVHGCINTIKSCNHAVQDTNVECGWCGNRIPENIALFMFMLEG